MAFEHLKIPDSWQSYWTKYPEGYTLLEGLINWLSQVDLMIDHINGVDGVLANLQTNLEEFYLKFDEELRQEIQIVLQAWIEDGTLEQVISQLIENRAVYPNIPALQQAPNIFQLGAIVELQGYEFAGDGLYHKRIISDSDDGSGVQVGNKWANLVHDKTKQLNADIFSGTDSEKIQKAYDYLVEKHKYGIIELSRKYFVDQSILLKPTRYDALGITLKGGQIELATKFLFSSTANNNEREAVRVENITFTTTLSEDVYVYDCDNMIKPIITACNFEGVNCAYSTKYIQSVYISNSDIRNNGAFISAPILFDGKIRGNRFETSSKLNAHVVKIFGTPTISYSIDNLVITDNLIEGYVNTTPLIFGSSKGLLVSGTYTELNKGFIEFVNDGISVYAGTIVDNFLNRPAEGSPVFIKVAAGDQRLTITGNNGNWYGTNLTDADVTKCTIGSNSSLNGGSQSAGNRQPGRIVNEYDVRKTVSPTLLRSGSFDTDRITKLYRFDGTSQGTKPSGVAGGFIESVFTDEADWGYQKLYQTNTTNMYVRYFFGGSWTTWIKFTGV